MSPTPLYQPGRFSQIMYVKGLMPVFSSCLCVLFGGFSLSFTKIRLRSLFCRLDAQGFVEIVSVLVGNGNKLFVVFLLLFF